MKGRKKKRALIGQYLLANLYDFYYLRNTKEYDTIVAIDGNVGDGKSTLGYALVKAWNYIAGVKYEQPLYKEGLYAYGGRAFVEAVYKAKVGSGVIYDEAGDFSKFVMLSRSSQRIARIFETIRQKKLFIALILPDFFELDPRISKKRLRALIHITEPRKSVGVYSLPKIYKLINKASHLQIPRYAFRLVRPDFYDHWSLPVDYKEFKKWNFYQKKKENLRMIMDSKGLISLREAEKEFKLSKYKLIKLIEAKKIQAEKIKNAYGVKRESIKNYLEDQLLKEKKVPVEIKEIIDDKIPKTPPAQSQTFKEDK